MEVYIKGVGNISPQKTFDESLFKEGIVPFNGNRLNCIEPDYAQFIDPKKIRRMSRVIKMGVVSSLLAMKDAGIDKPDAIIVGTALGCLEDTVSFLTKLVEYKEEMLSPTAFIHSTHNTIAAQIALTFQCKGYNSTYVHRNISFESALLDAALLLEENAAENVLVGGIDELTEASFKIFKRLGHYKEAEEIAAGNLYNNTKGSVGGEGSAFFALTNKPDANCYAKILGIKMVSFSSADDVSAKAKLLLLENGVDNVDLLIAGYNGDEQDDMESDKVISGLGMDDVVLKYKHLCGEYGTAASFALWMASTIAKNGEVPEVFGHASETGKKVKNILIYNHYKKLHHSFMLLSAC